MNALVPKIYKCVYLEAPIHHVVCTYFVCRFGWDNFDPFMKRSCTRMQVCRLKQSSQPTMILGSDPFKCSCSCSCTMECMIGKFSYLFIWHVFLISHLLAGIRCMVPYMVGEVGRMSIWRLGFLVCQRSFFGFCCSGSNLMCRILPDVYFFVLPKPFEIYITFHLSGGWSPWHCAFFRS